MKSIVLFVVFPIFGLLQSGCSPNPQASPTDRNQAMPSAAEPTSNTAQLTSKVSSTGKNSDSPTAASDVNLTDEELLRIRGMHARAAIALHYSGNDWSNAQVEGLKTQFQEMGISVIAVTDSGFKPEKQVSDLETLLAKKPNIIVSIPTDPVATAGIYKKIAESGVKLVFMDNVPRGLIPRKDYVSVVSADNFGNGAAAAALMAGALGGRGNIGIIYNIGIIAADFPVTRERYDGFKKTITNRFPQIHIIAEQGIGGPDFSADAERVALSMITSHRDINGIWAVWDVPAEGVIAAARTVGREKLVITTCDLGENVALDMARGGFIKGIGAQRPFDQGVTEALLAGYALLGKVAPVYVVLPAMPVTSDNLLEAWRLVYHKDAPANLRNILRVAVRTRKGESQ